jgi:hypothetical protein
MKASDYTPGPVIDTPEQLRDVLANEDAAFLHGAFVETAYFRKYVSSGWPRADTGDGRFRRAFLKCPQTAKEMRAHNPAHNAHKEKRP